MIRKLPMTALATLALTAGLYGMSLPAYATDQADQRQESRDTKQEGRDNAREVKEES
jgi:hypothetical protein